MQTIKQLLIVEDNSADLFLLREYITQTQLQGDEIITAEKIQQVLGLPSSFHPDLIFLDLNLPDSNGIETFLTINNRMPGAAIIVVGRLNDTDIALQAIQAGAQDYIIKGEFDEKLLSKAVSHAIERKKNQLKLRESEERYKMLVESAPEALVILDVEKRVFTDVSESAEAFFKMSKEALLKVGPAQVSPKYQPGGSLSVVAAMQHINLAIAGKKPVFEWVHMDKEGNEISCEVRLVRLPSDQQVLIRGSIIDITERKKAEEEIRKSNERFEMIAATTHDAIWEWNLETNGMWANETHQQLYGLTLQDAVPDEKEWEQRIHPDEREAQIKKQAAALASATNVFITEYRFNTEEFGYKNIYDRCYIVRNAEGKAVRILGSMMDITERKQAEQALKTSEEKYRSLVANAPDIILVIDLSYTIEFANYAIGGYTKEQVIGKDIFYFLPPGYHGEVRQVMKKVITERKTMIYETAGYDTDGSMRWYLTNAGPIISDNKVTGITLIVRDNTERKNAQKEMADTKELLEETSRMASIGGWEIDLIADKLTWTSETKKIHEVDDTYIPDIETAINFYKEGESRDMASRLVKEAMVDHTPFDFESIIITAKGDEKWVRAKGQPEFKDHQCIRVFGTFQDIHEKKIKEVKEKSRTYILELLNANAPLSPILESLIRGAEQVSPGMICSILLLSEEGKLTLGAAPGLPDFYNKVIDGISIGPNVGSCGAAAYTGERVIVENIQEHPFWEPYKDIAKKAGLQACWSEPIKDAEGKVLGTFACYYVSPFSPSDSDIENLKAATDLALIVLEKFRYRESIIKTEQRFRSLVQNISEIITLLDENGYIKFASSSIKNILGYEEDELIDKHIFEFIHPEDRVYISDAFANAVKVPGIAPPVQFRILNKAGEYIDLEATGNNQLHNPLMKAVIITSRDISYRLEAERILKLSEKKYRTLIEQATDGIFVADPGGRFEIINESCSLLSGYTMKEMEKMSFRDLTVEEDLEKHPFHFEELHQGKNVITERLMRNKAGEILDIEINARLLEDGHLVAFVRDVTERKKAAEDILKSNARFQMVSKATSDIVWDWTLADDSLWWNDNYYSTLGYKKKNEIVHIEDWFSHIHPDDVKQVRSTLQKSFAGTDLIWQGDYQYAQADGTCLHFIDRGFIMRNKDGKAYRMIGSMVDVTPFYEAQKKIADSEERYRTLVEQAIDAIALYDAKGKILDVNTGSVNLLGYTKEELLQMNLSDVLTKEEIKVKPVQYDVLQEGNSTVKQRDMMKKDGAVVQTEVRSQQLPDGRFLSVIRDLTDRVNAEKELAASYDAIRKLTGHIQDIREEERTNMAREIHDELGQQLTVLKMDVSWLNKRISGTDDLVKQKLHSLLTMLDETVKTVRRISSELRPSLLDDLGLISAIEWQLEEFEKRSGINTGFVHTADELELPSTIKTALFRIFQESLTNVARHSGALKVTVIITRKADTLVLSIADNGKGFDKQEIVTRRTLGILGMKERAAMVGGLYEIKSEPGKGTEVVVKVKLNQQ